MKILIFTAFLILSRSSMTYACSCLYRDFETNFANSEVVFLATIVPTSNSEWNLEIQRVWKGSVSKRGKLRDSLAGTNCEIGEFIKPLVVNVRYIIFARKSKKINVFYTEACGGVREVDDKLLLNLGKGHPPGRSTVTTPGSKI